MEGTWMPISAIHHVAVNVSDLERSIAFYRDVLGFRKVLDMKADGPANQRMLRRPPGTKIRSVMMAQGDSAMGEIELIQMEPLEQRQTGPKRPGDLGIWVISLEVKDEPLADVCRRLHDQGVKFFSDRETIDLEGYAPMQAVMLEDPDGNLVELVQLPSKEEYKRLKREREMRAAK
jgi:catechol 2,3-dioxygenase-like lactoylglutathione lyase family enzyme